MDIKGLILKQQGDTDNGSTVKDPVLSWIILVSMVFTTFSFWGWISYTLIEHAKKRDIPVSTVYFFIMIGGVGILVGAYVLYTLFVRQRQVNIPEVKESKIKLRKND